MMPGVGIMENGFRDTLPTNHDRLNGQHANGNSQPSPDRQNGLANRSSGAGGSGGGGNTGVNGMVNGNENGHSAGIDSDQPQRSVHGSSRMNDLPDEIQHITQGYVPLGVLLSRLAQQTHNQLSDEIMALAKMPVSASAVNGNSAHGDAAFEDASAENLSKKVRLLNFVQEKHAEWVKALVIANWSRKAEPVSKLIDLMHHINMQRKKYDDALDYMINIKRDLTFARVPNPDLKTALYVLATGTAPWMPDLGYIAPPPLTPKEQLQWIENLNTLLSIRLNLEEHENIPQQFQDYTIDSGRVTFKVPGEFEVDLTIADEDFDKQFWFIDFRFAFTPAPPELSDTLRMYLEQKTNEVLEKDGLHGCYKFLHEFVLTHKITEYVRQAHELRKGRWVDTLKVERLNRAMSIQYWSNRYPPDGPKSWVILGVHSGKKSTALSDLKTSSYLTLRWFRDNKEVKDVEIPIDDANISTEELLTRVVGKHIEYILSTIHERLKSKGRFMNREAGLVLDISRDDPAESSLKMQLGYNYYVNVKLSPITGMFAMKPQSSMTMKGELKLNWSSKDPIQDGIACLEGVRCHYAVDELIRRGKSVGWNVCKGPVKLEDVKPLLNTRDHGQLMWLQRRGWSGQWYLMVSLSLSGDRWWLIEATNQSTEPQIGSFTQLPLSSGSPNLSDTFFSNLTVCTAAMISHIIDLRALNSRKIKHATRSGINYSLPANIKIPAIYLRLADVLAQRRSPESEKKTPSWAHDYVKLVFKGMNSRSSAAVMLAQDATGTSGENRLRTLVDARIKVTDASRFALLAGKVERDVAFNERIGVFAFRLEAAVGESILDMLVQRLQALERLVDCVDAIRESKRDIRCEEITLDRVVVRYSGQPSPSTNSAAQAIQHWKASLDLRADGVKISLEKGNPQLRVLDTFQSIVNSELRVSNLPFLLSGMLPLHQALDSIEASWESLAMNNQGQVNIVSAHIDWFNIHYVLPGRNVQRRLTLQVRLKPRRADVQWHVFREEPGATKQPDDEFKKLLQKVWTAENRGWRGLNDSAMADIDHIGELIRAVDEVIRPLAMQSPTMVKQMQPKGAPSLPKNQNQKMNKARQQPPGAVVVLDD
ncbi:mediator complex subunit MED14-domain-containing protein [Biscogniauxia mediterranea]|nr:mediator complex subunit MED14-domain-containing protein [Biscogniauxia mediterranea]